MPRLNERKKKEPKPKKESRRGKHLAPRPKRPSVQEMMDSEPSDVGYMKAVSADAIGNVPAATWAAFLHALATTGHVTKSCQLVGLNRLTAYARRRGDSEFRDLWEEAHAIGLACLEDEAKRRAYEGVEKGIYYKGDLVATETVYSDQLLMFLLQGTNPKYKRKQEITGADGGPLGMLAKLDDDGLTELIKQRLRELQETPDA